MINIIFSSIFGSYDSDKQSEFVDVDDSDTEKVYNEIKRMGCVSRQELSTTFLMARDRCQGIATGLVRAGRIRIVNLDRWEVHEPLKPRMRRLLATIPGGIRDGVNLRYERMQRMGPWYAIDHSHEDRTPSSVKVISEETV